MEEPYRSQHHRLKMERHQILEKPKLSFSASFKEAFKILSANPKFIFITIFFNFPLLASLLAHHILLHPTFIQLLKLLYHGSPLKRPGYIELTCIGTTCTGHEPDPIESFKATLSHRFLISTFLFSAIIYFVDLLNTIATVSISAALYGGNSQLGFKEMVVKATRVGLKGPLATSLCAVLLASLTLLGLVALSTNMFLMTKGQGMFSMYYIDTIIVSSVLILVLVFGLPFVVLLAKYIEWSAVWNMGIVISILDKNRGYIAIGVASYLSRGSRKVGFSLMMVFFVLKVFLWLPYVYTLWNEGGSCGIIGNVVFVSFNCVGNIVMWIVLMVYFYDCKREFLVKKIDLENNGKASDVVPQ